MVASQSSISISCFKVQSSIGHLVWFFDSRNSIVSGGNSCCPNRTYYAKCPDSPLKIFPFKKNNLFIISQMFQLWNWFDNCAVVGWVSEVPLSSMPRVGMEQRRTLDFNKSRLSTFYQASQTTRFSGNADTVLSLPGASSRSLSGYKGHVLCQFQCLIFIGPAQKYFFPQLDLRGRRYPRECFHCCVFFKLIVNTNTIIGAFCWRWFTVLARIIVSRFYLLSVKK